MVQEKDVKKARELLSGLQMKHKAAIACPNCGSHNMEFVSTPRKAMNWFSAIITFFLGDYALTTNKVYHCFDCKKEFPENFTETIPGNT
jgi:DNA-directed RNA polymerase subunit RPC12/RpoP